MIEKFIIVVSSSLITWLITRQRSKLFYYLVAKFDHSFTQVNKETGEPYKINYSTHQIIIFNKGNKKANNVKVIHSEALTKDNITCNIAFDMKDDNKTIYFSEIVPNETVQISYFNFMRMHLPKTDVRSDDGYAKLINITNVPILKKWQNNLIVLLMLLGIVFLMLIVIKVYPFMWSWFTNLI